RNARECRIAVVVRRIDVVMEGITRGIVTTVQRRIGISQFAKTEVVQDEGEGIAGVGMAKIQAVTDTRAVIVEADDACGNAIDFETEPVFVTGRKTAHDVGYDVSR